MLFSALPNHCAASISNQSSDLNSNRSVVLHEQDLPKTTGERVQRPTLRHSAADRAKPAAHDIRDRLGERQLQGDQNTGRPEGEEHRVHLESAVVLRVQSSRQDLVLVLQLKPRL